MGTIIDLTGQTFGSLTVIRRDGFFEHRSQRVIAWLCRCDCGNNHRARGQRLRSGETDSCGCVPRSHGMTHTPEFHAWTAMKQRCSNPRNEQWDLYGGRGISVCAEWQGSFDAFFAHVGPRPTPDHSIDRIDDDGNYEPGNVRWATPEIQNRNRGRYNIRLTFRGETRCASEWADRFGLRRGLVYDRIQRLGWSVERALTTAPVFRGQGGLRERRPSPGP